MYRVYISYPNFEKMHRHRLRWFRHVQRTTTNVENITVDEKRIHGKPK